MTDAEHSSEDIAAMEAQAEQLRRYLAAKTERDDLEAKVIDTLREHWRAAFHDDYEPDDLEWNLSTWLRLAGPEIVEGAVSAGGRKRDTIEGDDDRLRYVGACVRNMLRERGQKGDPVPNHPRS